MNRLESLRRRVREARDLMEAADFARYVLNSQMRKFLAPYDNQGPLKVDSAALGLSAADLLRQVQGALANQSSRARIQRRAI
jgi:hypothetical protein